MRIPDNKLLRIFFGLPFSRPDRGDLRNVLQFEDDVDVIGALGMCSVYFDHAATLPISRAMATGSQRVADAFRLVYKDVYEHESTDRRWFYAGCTLVERDIGMLQLEQLAEKYRDKTGELECALRCESMVRSGLVQLLGSEAHDIATSELTSAT